MSFMPSGVQKLSRTDDFCFLPMAAEISRQRLPCSTQKSRMARLGCVSGRPLAAFGCAKNVGLKSSLSPPAFAQSIQFLKWSTVMASRSGWFGESNSA